LHAPATKKSKGFRRFAGTLFCCDPGRGDSFGLHRCGILAEQIILGHEQGKRALVERFEGVEAGFARHGISLDRPYLNSGSNDDYSFAFKQSQSPRPREKLTIAHGTVESSAFRQTACTSA
jgi:hypothetical protein